MDLLIFLGVLSVLVLVHELGHYLVARFFGIKVLEFGFGLPPRLWGRQVGDTLWSINALPIGGFVRLLGEERGELGDSGEMKRAFFDRPVWQKSMVIVAGVVMNFMLAAAIFTIIYARSGIPTKTDDVVVVGVAKNSPAEGIGIAEGDKIEKLEWEGVGGERIERNVATSDEFVRAVREERLGGLTVWLKRGDESISVVVVPRVSPPAGEGPLGVAISNVVPRFYPWWEMPFRAVYYGVGEAMGWTSVVARGLVRMVWELVTLGKLPADVSGPVGIFQVTAEVAKTGIANLMHLVAILSVNLAVLNVLPLPALDGGRLAFILIEGVFRRKLAADLERYVHAVGLIILVGLIAAITIRDLQRVFLGGS